MAPGRTVNLFINFKISRRLEQTARQARSRMRTLARGITREFSNIFKRATFFRLSTIAINSFFNAINLALRETVEFQKALAAVVKLDIARFGQVGSASFNELRESIRGAAAEFGVTAVAAADAFKIVLTAGFRGTQASQLFRTALLAQASAGLSAKDAVGLLIAVMKQFNVTVDQSEDALNVLLKVQSDAAIGFEDFAGALKTGGAALSTTTKSLNEAAGLIAALGEISRESGTEVGTFFKTLSARITGRPETAKLLADLGIDVSDEATGELRSLTDILEDIAVVTDRLQTAERKALLGRIAGVRQVNRLENSLKSLGRARELQESSLSAEREARRRLAIEQDTLAFKFNRLRTEFVGAIEEGLGPAMDSFVDSGKAVAQVMIDVTNALVELGKQVGLIPADVVRARQTTDDVQNAARLAEVSFERGDTKQLEAFVKGLSSLRRELEHAEAASRHAIPELFNTVFAPERARAFNAARDRIQKAVKGLDPTELIDQEFLALTGRARLKNPKAAAALAKEVSNLLQQMLDESGNFPIKVNTDQRREKLSKTINDIVVQMFKSATKADVDEVEATRAGKASQVRVRDFLKQSLPDLAAVRQSLVDELRQVSSPEDVGPFIARARGILKPAVDKILKDSESLNISDQDRQTLVRRLEGFSTNVGDLFAELSNFARKSPKRFQREIPASVIKSLRNADILILDQIKRATDVQLRELQVGGTGTPTELLRRKGTFRNAISKLIADTISGGIVGARPPAAGELQKIGLGDFFDDAEFRASKTERVLRSRLLKSLQDIENPAENYAETLLRQSSALRKARDTEISFFRDKLTSVLEDPTIGKPEGFEERAVQEIRRRELKLNVEIAEQDAASIKKLTERLRGLKDRSDDAARVVSTSSRRLAELRRNEIRAADAVVAAEGQLLRALIEFVNQSNLATISARKITGEVGGLTQELDLLEKSSAQIEGFFSDVFGREVRLDILRRDSLRRQLDITQQIISRQQQIGESFLTSGPDQRAGIVRGFQALQQVLGRFGGDIRNFNQLGEDELNSFGRTILALPQDLRQAMVEALRFLPEGGTIAGFTSSQIRNILSAAALGRSEAANIRGLPELQREAAEKTVELARLQTDGIAIATTQLDLAREQLDQTKAQTETGKIALEVARQNLQAVLQNTAGQKAVLTDAIRAIQARAPGLNPPAAPTALPSASPGRAGTRGPLGINLATGEVVTGANIEKVFAPLKEAVQPLAGIADDLKPLKAAADGMDQLIKVLQSDGLVQGIAPQIITALEAQRDGLESAIVTGLTEGFTKTPPKQEVTIDFDGLRFEVDVKDLTDVPRQVFAAIANDPRIRNLENLTAALRAALDKVFEQLRSEGRLFENDIPLQLKGL